MTSRDIPDQRCRQLVPIPGDLRRLRFQSRAVDPRFVAILEFGEVGVDHDPRQLVGMDRCPPAELHVGLTAVADERVDLRPVEIALAEADVLLPIEPGVLEGRTSSRRTVTPSQVGST